MRDSWIDKEEFEEFAEAFSPRKKSSKRPPREEPETEAGEEEGLSTEDAGTEVESAPVSEFIVTPFESDHDDKAEVESGHSDDPSEEESEETIAAELSHEVGSDDGGPGLREGGSQEIVERQDEVVEDHESEETADVQNYLEPLTGIEFDGEDSPPEFNEESVGESDDAEVVPESVLEISELPEIASAPDAGAESEIEDFPPALTDEGSESSGGIPDVSEENSESTEEKSEFLSSDFDLESDFEVSSIPGLEISSPFVGEGPGESLDSIDETMGLDSENLSEDGEDVLPPEEDPPIEEEEGITKLVVEEPVRSDNDEHLESDFLAGIDLADDSPAENAVPDETEMLKAVKLLADARDRADLNQLIRSRRVSLETDAAEETASDADASEDVLDLDDPSPDLSFEPEGTFTERLAQFAFLAEETLEATRVEVVDRDGYRLHGSEGTGVEKSIDLFQLLDALRAIPRSVGLRELRASQVTSGQGTWFCLVPAVGPQENIVAKFEIDRPLEQSTLDALAKALAVAVNPANALA